MTGRWGVRAKRAWCPACDDGWVGHFVTGDESTTLFVCVACEASWRSSDRFDPRESRPLARALTDLGLPPRRETVTDVSPNVWFADLGYTLTVTSDADAVYWAALGSANNPDFSIQQYGRGSSAEEAAESARRRWQTEEIGSPTAHRRRRRPLPP